MAHSISASETNLFATLANPRRVDMTRKPPAPVDLSATPFVTTTGSKRTAAEDFFAPPPSRARGDDGSSKEDDDDDEDDDDALGAALSEVGGGGLAVASSDSGGDSSERRFSQRRSSQEKHALLLELRRLEQGGSKLSRSFGMADSIESMEYEVERHRIQADTDTSVAFMKDAIKLGLSGLEIVNQKLGPFLMLDGWSDTVTGDMNRFDPSLKRIYKRLFRRGAPNPFVELAMIIFGSMVLHHFKCKVLGKSAAAAVNFNPMDMLGGALPGAATLGATTPGRPLGAPPRRNVPAPARPFDFGPKPPMRRPVPPAATSAPAITSAPVSAPVSAPAAVTAAVTATPHSTPQVAPKSHAGPSVEIEI